MLVSPRGLWGIFFMLALAQIAQAHQPFDNSVRAAIEGDSLIVSVTVGADATAAILQAASPDKAIAPPGMGRKDLPAGLASGIVELRSGAEVLSAAGLQISGDGLEYTFSATYPRPPSETLSFRARYFEISPVMRQGSFVFTDEAGRQLGAALLSRASPVVECSVPLPPAPAVAGNTPPETHPSPAEPAPIPAATSAPQDSAPAVVQPSFGRYVLLGLEHILGGYDHLLFLCALLIACHRIKPMLAVITCFTLAHSVTLALAAFDLVQISPRIVEPLIAASIVIVGIENFRGRMDLKTRCGITLAFGLIHGFGFAGALRGSGLAERGATLAVPLLGFNLGVECGQLAVAAIFLPLLFLARRARKFEIYGTPAVSAVVILLGGSWLLQRLFF